MSLSKYNPREVYISHKMAQRLGEVKAMKGIGMKLLVHKEPDQKCSRIKHTFHLTGAQHRQLDKSFEAGRAKNIELQAKQIALTSTPIVKQHTAMKKHDSEDSVGNPDDMITPDLEQNKTGGFSIAGPVVSDDKILVPSAHSVYKEAKQELISPDPKTSQETLNTLAMTTINNNAANGKPVKKMGRPKKTQSKTVSGEGQKN